MKKYSQILNHIKKLNQPTALRISTHNDTYGHVQLYLYKYQNPQIRNSFKLITEYNINESNTRGCILYKQNHSDIIINSITSNQTINKPIRNYEVNNNNELFYAYDNEKLDKINEGITY